MPYIKGTASSFDDLIIKIIAWVTDSAIHGGDAWELMRNEPWPRGTILKAHGWEDGEHFYIGLMPQKIVVGKTYAEWLLSRDVILSELAYGTFGFSPDTVGRITVNANGFTVGTQNPVSYSITAPEIFTNSAQAMFLGVFKQYSDGLAWHEQAGAGRRTALAKPLFYYTAGSDYPNKITPPLYPGVGFPAIGMNANGPENGYIDFWLWKDAHRLTIVTNNNGFWDLAHLGFLEPYHKPTEYAFPAVAIGGTSGVTPVGELLWYPRQSRPSPETGFRFDYSLSNWSLSHGLPTFAAIPADGSPDDTMSAVSQAQLMLPDGVWQSFSNWYFQEQIISEYGVDYPTYSFAFQEPYQTAGIKHYIRPTYSNVGRTQNVYSSDESSHCYQLEPIEFVENRSEALNFFGRLKNIYWASTPIYSYGEQKIGGKLCLVLPNGFEGRKWHYAHGKTGLTNPADLLAQDRRIEELSKTMNCIVRLED